MRRVYYADSLLTSFESVVASCAPADNGHFHVVLDATAFYPTSGGQPHDLGTLEIDGRHLNVVDVIDDEATGEVVHVVNASVAAGTHVRGEIDRSRRVVHMQQHTGQHILSAVFDQQHRAKTVSFHMGSASSTIDLAREVTPAEMTAAEAAANGVVFDDLEVGIRYASAEEAAAMPLRKESGRTGTLRLIEVPGVDLSACGGTHVPRTGMIGLVVITGWERFKGGTRVSFACGWRAVSAHSALRDITMSASRMLTVAASDLPDSIGRMQTQIKEQQRSIRDLQEQVTARLAAELRDAAEPGPGGAKLIVRAQPGWDAGAIKFLASAIVSVPGFIVVLTGDGSPVPVVAARSADVGFDAGAWIKDATAALGGRGGGRPELAQGGIVAGTNDILARANDLRVLNGSA